ncbi:hypothetical protein [Vibrio metschnikovii]|uniref:hypothetical protein n=1 Tax=Vibrio metschnikovii TaxID=28172 RepID=UPI001C2F1A36|nr:hypothetical protein [Vibrio metschnikovii]
MEKHFKGCFSLHYQSVQALIQKFCANIDSTRTKRKEGDKKAQYPWRDQKKFQIVMWKGGAVKRQGNRLRLSCGAGRKPLSVKVPTKTFFDVTLPEVAGSLASRITDNFQILKPASSS